MLELVKDSNIRELLTNENLQKFQIYSDFLIEYNQKVNLTAIIEPEDIKVKHFVDSLSILTVMDIKEGATVIDVGTGAGFPGIPLKIVRPDIKLTLLDSLNKRLIFLEELSEKLGQSNKLIHGRAEQVSQESPFRDGYELVLSRAVGRMAVLVEYCLPFVQVGGIFAAYKGPEYEEELEQAKKAIKLIGGKIKEVKTFKIGDEMDRSIVLIEKIEETPDKYPRKGIKIAKNPLL